MITDKELCKDAARRITEKFGVKCKVSFRGGNSKIVVNNKHVYEDDFDEPLYALTYLDGFKTALEIAAKRGE